MKRFMVVVIGFIVIVGGGYLLFREGSLPVDKTNTQTKIFVIKKGEGLETIAKNLSSEGLIRNKIVFYLVVKRLEIDKTIQAGDFRLSPSMDVYELSKNLTHGTHDQWVTVVEGLRKEEIAQIMSTQLGIPEVEFLHHAQEGYLFPDTYLFPKDASGESVVQIMNGNLNKKFTPHMRSQALKLGLTEAQVLTLASIVEREAKTDADRVGVASVLLRRYNEDYPLQSDITIQYALGYQEDAKTWWKPELSLDDLKIDSPYNMYVHKGLPPTPVSNPGLSSINAVLDANPNTPYFFYVSDSKGRLHFARTNEEHEANIKKYMQK